MPLPVSTLPWHIQNQIAEKTGLSDFVAFKQASEQSLAMANRVKSRFTLPLGRASEVSFGMYNEDIQCRIRCRRNTMIFKLSEIPQIRFDAKEVYIIAPFNEEFCQRLTSFFFCSGSTTSTLQICQRDGSAVNCSPESLRDLLESARVEELYVERGKISTEAFRAIPEFVKQIICTAPLSDDDLLSTKAEDIRIGGTLISNKGINYFLKEWKEGKRKFQKLYISVENFNISEILAELEYSMTLDVWNRKFYAIEKGSEVVNINLAETLERPILHIEVKENKNKK